MAIIPFVDLRRQYVALRDAMLESATRVLDTCAFINGPDDIGPGDEVITTVHTAIATAEAISMTGANVVFSDICLDTCNIDPKDVARKITTKTKAIIAVHLYGHPAELDPIVSIARKNNLSLVEDCAQAMGAEYHGEKVGKIGDTSVFSFFPSKPLGGFGDGGAVISKHPNLIKRIRMFCNHGRQSKYWHEFEGINSRLDTINAAMLRNALPHLDDWNAARRQIAAGYEEHLKDIPGLELPHVPTHCRSVWHVYAVRVPDRKALQEHMKEKGISTGIHYPYALNVLPAFSYLGKGPGSFPNAEYHCQHTLSLPMFPELNRDELEYICSVIRKFFDQT
jgi:dTDP-4-amino-4,6-dideoxygalactose transaminase